MNYMTLLQKASKSGKVPAEAIQMLKDFYSTYVEAAAANKHTQDAVEPILMKLLELSYEQFRRPFAFEPYHKKIVSPYNYYQFGIDFIRPLVFLDRSKVFHPERVDQIQKQLNKGDNVILLANHQTELDPQAISLLLEKTHPKLAEDMIFIAGHRVVSDPLAMPFSMGRNLLCIFSKKHIEHDPSLKAERLLHNQRTMKLMVQLLAEGGECIYVAPSGGRDRMNTEGVVEVAEFDPQSIEMFWLMAQKSDRATHFYPLALSTYDLLPPPDEVKQDLGEQRTTSATPIHLSFGPEIDMDHVPDSDLLDKKQKRKVRAQIIWEHVKQDYQRISKANSA